MENSKIRLLIVDDEHHVRRSLKSMIDLLGHGLDIVGEAGSVREALEKIHETSPDLLLLDVQLGDGSGFDVLRKISKPLPNVIFITAHENYALQAFRFSAIDYLLKPVDPVLLKDALDKVRSGINHEGLNDQMRNLLSSLGNTSRENKKIVLRTSDHIHVVHVKEIMHLESDRNYTTFFVEGNEPVVVSKTLKEYDELLEGYGFARVHQSHLVNLNYIDKFDKRDGGMLILRDGSKVPVSTRRKDDLIRLLDHL